MTWYIPQPTKTKLYKTKTGKKMHCLHFFCFNFLEDPDFFVEVFWLEAPSSCTRQGASLSQIIQALCASAKSDSGSLLKIAPEILFFKVQYLIKTIKIIRLEHYCLPFEAFQMFKSLNDFLPFCPEKLQCLATQLEMRFGSIFIVDLYSLSPSLEM